MSIPPRVSAAVPGRLSVHRSPKRQRLGETYYSSSSSSDEEEAGIAEAVGVTRTAITANDSSSSSDDEEEEEEEEVGIAEAAGVTRTTAAIDSDSSSSSDEEEDLLIVRLANVPRTATIANDPGNVTRSVNRTPEASSSSFSSPQSVKLKSSDVLDCPTCCEPLKKPIYQCSNGHLACSPCVTKLLSRCPFCRSHIGDIRCRAMEKIIETSVVSCRNSVYGCQETSTYGNQSSSHEKLCAYVPCSCPLPSCDYAGSYEDLKSHARSSHIWHSWDEEGGNRFEFATDRPLTFRLNLEKEKATTVFREEKEGDLIVVQGFRKPDGVYVTVSCIAPTIPGIRRFSCSLANLNERTSLRLGLMVKQIQKVGVKEEEPKDGFLLIPPYMLTSGHLKMQICIGSGCKYIHI